MHFHRILPATLETTLRIEEFIRVWYEFWHDPNSGGGFLPVSGLYQPVHETGARPFWFIWYKIGDEILEAIEWMFWLGFILVKGWIEAYMAIL